MSIKNEIEIMKMVNHPNITKLEDFFRDSKHIYIVMELVNGGDLEQLK